MNVDITPQQARELAQAAEKGRDAVYVDQDGLSDAIKQLRTAAAAEEKGH